MHTMPLSASTMAPASRRLSPTPHRKQARLTYKGLLMLVVGGSICVMIVMWTDIRENVLKPRGIRIRAGVTRLTN